MGYILEKQQKGEDKWERCNDFLVPVLSYTVRGLTEGKNYTFRVKAENAAGISEPSRNSPFIKASDAIGKHQLQGLRLCRSLVHMSANLLSLRSSKGLPEWQLAVRSQREARLRDLPGRQHFRVPVP